MQQAYPDISDILKTKQQRRFTLAALSWEEKVAIIERMQRHLPLDQWKSRTVTEQTPSDKVAKNGFVFGAASLNL